jgi:signal transduction histidine kinase
MMYEFLANNRDDLIARCRHKVSMRPGRAATAGQLRNGVPIFLDQLIRTLELEQADEPAQGAKISGPAGGAVAFSEVRTYAELHGKDLLDMDFTVDQVVHDYGDLCQAVTDLAIERDAPFEIEEYRTLNRCLDNAIANAVSEFSYQRDFILSDKHEAYANERIAHLAQELRNLLSTATLAFSAAKAGGLGLNGATGTILERSLGGVAKLIDNALDDARQHADGTASLAAFSLAHFIDEAVRIVRAAEGGAGALVALPVDARLAIVGNRTALLGAVCHLLRNAIELTRPGTEVTLTAYSAGERVIIDVKDHRGGPVPRAAMSRPFIGPDAHPGRGGWNLAVARQAVLADAGELTAVDTPEDGCVFTISVPRREGLT